MSGRGRPLRFLALVALGWTGARIALLWPEAGSLPAAIKAFVPRTAIAAARPRAAPVQSFELPTRDVPSVQSTPRMRSALAPVFAALPPPRADPLRIQMALLGLVQFGKAEAFGMPPTGSVAPAPDRIEPRLERWSASAWAALRPGHGIGNAPGGGQLGGSQAGLRLAYMLAPEQRLAAVARFTAPIGTRGREVSLGLEWQPTRAPVRIVAEQRFALDGGGSGPGAGVIAGVDAVLAEGFRLESYGQAGVVRRRRLEPYVDGAARATRDVVDARGVRLALGAGLWGGAQRDASRVDLGPSATLALPVAGQTMRLALDWRQRIAGDARPGSGPALTIGSDF